MPVSALAARWCRGVPALREGTLRAAYLRAEMDRHSITNVALALDTLCGRAEQADPIAREVLAAVLLVLGSPGAEPRVVLLRRLAEQGALLPLGRLLRRRHRDDNPSEGRPTGTRQTAEKPPPGVLPASSTGRALSLGERRALARRPSRAALDKLLRDPHPMVIRNLLSNPRLTEDDVVRMAARRPAVPEVLAEIASHPVFSQRQRVRMAIIQNPGAPPTIAVPLVSLLIRPELLRVVAAVDVPALVRAAATELLDRRPPVPDRGDRGKPQ